MLSPFSSPKRSRKGNKESKNPYSYLGLEKFSALLSELDEKRQSIYAKRLDSDGPPLVRFVFKSSGECVPIMIKTKKAGKKKDAQDDFKAKTETKTEEEKEIKKTEPEAEQKKSCALNENLEKISRPNHFLPVTAILVLIFLVFFGRTVSIMCTCIVWYLVPMIKEQSRNRGSTYETNKKKKKLNIENRTSFNQGTSRGQTVLIEKFPHLAAHDQNGGGGESKSMKTCGITAGMMNEEQYTRFSQKFNLALVYFILFMMCCWAMDLKIYDEATFFVVDCAFKASAVLAVAHEVVVRTMDPGFRVFDELSTLCLFVFFFASVGSLFYNNLLTRTA